MIKNTTGTTKTSKTISSSLKRETARYRIAALVAGERRDYLAILVRDDYGGWSEFHCIYREGAMALWLLQKGSRWLSKDRRYLIEKVEMLSEESFLRELERLKPPLAS